MSTVTFLLDLDNTLLDNDMNKFLPAFIAGLEPYLRPLLNGHNLQQALFGSMQRITANPQPDVSLLEAFMADFSARLNQSHDDISARLAEYYQRDFPRLQVYTNRRPAARKFTETLIAAGCNVVVATNPLFPETAIRQRIEWAGLADIEFNWVTTMENSHYAKPNPRYYQQALTAVAGDATAAWMVGDDLELDMEPARQLGLQTWWITDHLPAPAAPPVPDVLSGTLSEALAWVRNDLHASAN